MMRGFIDGFNFRSNLDCQTLAAPSTAACGPKELREMHTFSAGTKRQHCHTTRRARSRNKCPLCMTPPPRTILSGQKIEIRFASPRPSRQVRASRTLQENAIGHSAAALAPERRTRSSHTGRRAPTGARARRLARQGWHALGRSTDRLLPSEAQVLLLIVLRDETPKPDVAGTLYALSRAGLYRGQPTGD